MKSLSSVALPGSFVLRTCWRSVSRALNLIPGSKTFYRAGILITLILENDMPKAVRISIPIASSNESDAKSDTKADRGEFVWVALASGAGLLISLVLILKGVQAVWS